MASLSPTLRPWIFAVLGTVAMALCIALADFALPHGGQLWQGWETEHSTLVYFCEPAAIGSLLRQKVDTYTNLGFWFVGCLMIAYGWADQRLQSRHLHPLWSFWFGGVLWLTFTGSTLFHASLTRMGEAMDLAGTYASALLPGFFNLHRLARERAQGHRSIRPYAILWLVMWVASSALIFSLSSRVVVLSSLLLIGGTWVLLWLRIHPRRGWPWAVASLAFTVGAASFFVMDIRKVGCDPESWYQAHGLWHLLGAAATGCYYAFMRSLSRSPNISH